MLPTLRRTHSLWGPIDSLTDDFGRMLDRWWGDGGQGDYLAFYPVDITEDDEHVYVEAELPGFAKDQINVTLENGMLHITAERKAETNKAGATHLNERRFARVSRSFTLPTSVDDNKVDAKLTDGVLHLTLNKREEVKPRRIEVK